MRIELNLKRYSIEELENLIKIFIGYKTDNEKQEEIRKQTIKEFEEELRKKRKSSFKVIKKDG